jgi:hypothetical protein
MHRILAMSSQLACVVFLHCLAVATVVLEAPVAWAQSTAPVPAARNWDASLMLKGGTLGVGPELEVRATHSPFGLRADVNGLAFSDDDLIRSHFQHAEMAYAYDSTVRFGGTVKLLNGGITGDYYPFGTGFRLSLGLLINGNKVTMHGVPVGRLRIAETAYAGSAPGRIDAGATFNALAPMAGLGYSRLLLKHLRVSVDIGAMYQGDPHLSYAISGAFAQLPSVAADAERERRRIQRLVDYPVYPIAILGIGWPF